MKTHQNTKLLSVLLAGFVAVACMAFAGVPQYGLAEEAEAQTQLQTSESQSGFSYEHNPIYNPSCMRDVVVNPDAVYGFSPNPDSGSLTKYAAYDWTDPIFVAGAQQERLEYFKSTQEMTKIMESMQAEGKSIEEIARAVSAKRNEIRLAAYKDDPEGLAAAKAHNLAQYGNENGPTPEFLYEKYGSWESVLDHAFSLNAGMDACCGLYDMNYKKYLMFGKIPSCQVSFEVSGHAETPASQTVYAGECATKPEDPEASGLTFLGWYADGALEPFDFATPIAADTVLTAAWEQGSSIPVVLGKNAPVTELSTKLDPATVISDEEKTLANEGVSTRVWVEVGETSSTQELQDNMAAAAAKRLGADSKVACYVDVNLFKQLETEDEPTNIHELSEKMYVTLSLSDEQIPTDADKRTWCVSREHNGVVEVLDASFDAATKTVSFSTDKLSSFAVAYSEVFGQAEAIDYTETRTVANRYVPYVSRDMSGTAKGTTTSSNVGTPNTGDPASVALPLVSFASACVLAGVGVRQKR